MKCAVANKAKDPWFQYFQDSLDYLKHRDLLRSLRSITPVSGPEVMVGQSRYLLFCSNDYLGLASEPRMKEAASKAALSYGTGSGASRLISGNLHLYGELEKEVSQLKSTEGSLVFSSGFAANVGVISALARSQDALILSDELNHASIIDGCRLSKAEVMVYPHCDSDYVRSLLSSAPPRSKILIVTDGIFSMDGDIAPLQELYALSVEYGALLLVDDAHGTGVIGENGAGSLEYVGLEGAEIVQIGTFSKALGGLGGFVAGSALVIDYLINRARSLIYSTGLPPSVLASNLMALKIVRQEPERRHKLGLLSRRLVSGLASLGFSIQKGPSPIFPLIIGGKREILELSRFLWNKGIFVPAIRPPTVPEGKSRLRISLSAVHTQEQVEELLEALTQFFRRGA